MSDYGKVALGALDRFIRGDAPSIRAAWDEEAQQVFGPGTRAAKVCPRTTFLGLCAEGVVSGVSQGDYVEGDAPNRQHGLAALELLEQRGEEFPTGRALWRAIGATKTYNQQMDVVLALWRAGLLKRQGRVLR